MPSQLVFVCFRTFKLSKSSACNWRRHTCAEVGWHQQWFLLGHVYSIISIVFFRERSVIIGERRGSCITSLFSWWIKFFSGLFSADSVDFSLREANVWQCLNMLLRRFIIHLVVCLSCKCRCILMTIVIYRFVREDFCFSNKVLQSWQCCWFNKCTIGNGKRLYVSLSQYYARNLTNLQFETRLTYNVERYSTNILCREMYAMHINYFILNDSVDSKSLSVYASKCIKIW